MISKKISLDGIIYKLMKLLSYISDPFQKVENSKVKLMLFFHQRRKIKSGKCAENVQHQYKDMQHLFKGICVLHFMNPALM